MLYLSLAINRKRHIFWCYQGSLEFMTDCQQNNIQKQQNPVMNAEDPWWVASADD